MLAFMTVHSITCIIVYTCDMHVYLLSPPTFKVSTKAKKTGVSITTSEPLPSLYTKCYQT